MTTVHPGPLPASTDFLSKSCSKAQRHLLKLRHALRMTYEADSGLLLHLAKNLIRSGTNTPEGNSRDLPLPNRPSA
jgi:hypothetical protein